MMLPIVAAILDAILEFKHCNKIQSLGVVIMKCRTVLSGNGNWADVAALYMKVNGWC